MGGGDYPPRGDEGLHWQLPRTRSPRPPRFSPGRGWIPALRRYKHQWCQYGVTQTPSPPVAPGRPVTTTKHHKDPPLASPAQRSVRHWAQQANFQTPRTYPLPPRFYFHFCHHQPCHSMASTLHLLDGVTATEVAVSAVSGTR